MSVKLKMMLLMGSLITVIVLLISIVGFINFKSASVSTYDRGLKNDAMVIGKAVEQKIGRTFDILHAVAEELAITSDEKIDEAATLKSLKSMTSNPTALSCPPFSVYNIVPLSPTIIPVNAVFIAISFIIKSLSIGNN